MKILGKFALILLFISTFFGFLLSTSFRFQFLDSKFWVAILEKPGFYEQLVSVLKRGATTEEDMALVSIVAKSETKGALEQNLKNILDFANGREKQLFVDIPKGLPIPAGRVSLDELNAMFPGMPNSVINPTNLIQLSKAGMDATISWGTSLALLIVILVLLYLLTDSGARFVSLGIALVLSGIFSLLIIGALTVIRINWTKDLASSASPGDAMLGTLAPPILERILGLWIYIAGVSIILGILLFFFKKPKKK